MTFQLLTLLLITNIETTINISAEKYDYAIFSANFDTKDNRPVYGIRLQSLDNFSNVINESWVTESYVPPMSETIPLILPKNVKTLKTIIFGPELNGKWTNANLSLGVIRPELSLTFDEGWIKVNWTDYNGYWKLQKKSLNNWEYTTNFLLPTEKIEIFRLMRE